MLDFYFRTLSFYRRYYFINPSNSGLCSISGNVGRGPSADSVSWAKKLLGRLGDVKV